MKKIITCISVLFILLLSGIKAQTSFSDTFTGAISGNWEGNGAYKLTQSDGMLNVNASTVAINSSFLVNTGGNINISSNPVFNMKIRSSSVCILKVTVYASDGTSASKELRIAAIVDSMVNYCIDFTGSTFTKTSVNKITFATNDFATNFRGTLYFDDLIIGTGAAQFANICPINDVVMYKGSTGQKIIVTDLANASGISITDAGALIANISYTSISTSASMGGISTITFDAGTPGTAIVSATALGTGGFSNNTSRFRITVEDNIAPTINQAANAKMAVGKIQTVNLSGISDGNLSIEQPLTITAASSASAVIPDPTVTYTQGSPYVVLNITPATAGTATITVTVKDNGTTNDTKTMAFDITAYTGFNYTPAIKAPVNQSMYLSDGTLNIKLTGIADGDGGTQNLTITGTGKHASVISNFSTSYTQGRDTAILTLTAAALGNDTITVTVTDNGDNGSNNGNQSTQIVFNIAVLAAPPTEFEVPMNDFTADTTAGLWLIERNDVNQSCQYIDTLGSKWIKISITGKSDWTGIWYNLPEEIDVSKYPYMTYKIMTKGFSPLLTHAYFYDVDTARNADGAQRQRDTITTNIADPHTVIMDFRAPNDQLSKKGEPINLARIEKILFNYHNHMDWPNTIVSGVVYIGDVRIGSKVAPATLPVFTPGCTIDPIPTTVLWAGTSGAQTIALSGISNGQGSTTGITFEVLSSKTPFISHPTIGTLAADGKATLTYTLNNANIDSATIVVRVKSGSATTKEMRFMVKTVSDVSTNAIAVNVDATTKKQTIVGFGGMAPPEYLLEKYVQDHGCTFMRITVNPEFEKTNDNFDATELNHEGFNKSKIDFNYIKKAYDAGVTDFFITLWAPPAWMMQSLSSVRVAGGPDWNVTNQKVDPIYYDEYVEYMVSIIRMIKEETGVEIAGFCPQNEPAFTEPYESGILNPARMAQVCGLLGKRLHEEGFNTKPVTGEQVFTQGNNPVTAYGVALKNDSLGKIYGKVVGNHYPRPDAAVWAAQNAASLPNELWATECHTDGNNYPQVLYQMEAMIIGYNNGCSAWALWGYNNGSSGNENDVTKKTGLTLGPNGTSKHYWAFKNWSKYVRKGAVQIKSKSENPNVMPVAFLHEANKTLTMVILNKDTKMPHAIKFTGSAPANGYKVYRSSFHEKCIEVVADKNGVYMLPPLSISTFVLDLDVNHAPTIDQTADVFMPMNGSITVNLTGISCGDPANQAITVTAISENTTVVETPEVTYTSPNTIGTLKLTAVANQYGKVKITVSLKDDGGTEKSGIDQTSMSFNVTVNNPNDIKDVSDQASVYPNPASDNVTVFIPSLLSGSKMVVSNAAGEIISEQVIAGDHVKADISSLTPGIYMITISNNSKIAKLKFAKQ